MLKEILEWPTTAGPAAVVHDDYFDLFVWQAGGEVTLIQLCYGAEQQSAPWYGTRNVFLPGRAAASQEVISRFRRRGRALPEDLRREVREKMHEFAGRRLAVLSGASASGALLAALGRLATAVVLSATIPSQGRRTHETRIGTPRIGLWA